jgi:hypothetical protein
LKSRRGKQHNPNFRRKAPFRDPKRLIFILCEGKETEPNYFKAIRAKKQRCNFKIEIPKNVNGTNPKKLLQYGKELKKDDPNDIVWCVFDHDERPYLNEIIQKMKNAGLEVAFSNPCFELWFLLHYTYSSSNLTSEQAKNELKKKYINDYDKSMSGIYSILEPHQHAAMFAAEQLRKYHSDNNNDEMSNPSTNVDKLVDFLESLKKVTFPKT